MASEHSLQRVPPNDALAEQSVLASSLISAEARNRIVEQLEPEDFYKIRHQTIYKGILELNERNEPVDLVTLTDQLRSMGCLEEAGGPSYLSDLFSVVPNPANAEHYARIVKNKATLRRLIQTSLEVAGKAYEEEGPVEEILDYTEREIFAVTQSKAGKAYTKMSQAVDEAFNLIEQLYDKGEAITGVPTGFKDLDEYTAGFQKSDMVILAARPSMGKTAMCLNLLVNASRRGIPALMFSLEMATTQLVIRMLCSEARMDGNQLRRGFIAKEKWPDLTRAASELSAMPIFIDDTPGITPREMRSKARRVKAEFGLGLVVIDYLQLMEVGGGKVESRTQEISMISRAIKALARELEVPVIALSQLSRSVESRNDKRPMLSDLRESGAIEQDADVVMFLYRDEYYNKDSEQKGVTEIIIGKQRNGPVGTIKLQFDLKSARFRDLSFEAMT